jgi:hypothetical protein
MAPTSDVVRRHGLTLASDAPWIHTLEKTVSERELVIPAHAMTRTIVKAAETHDLDVVLAGSPTLAMRLAKCESLYWWLRTANVRGLSDTAVALQNLVVERHTYTCPIRVTSRIPSFRAGQKGCVAEITLNVLVNKVRLEMGTRLIAPP